MRVESGKPLIRLGPGLRNKATSVFKAEERVIYRLFHPRTDLEIKG